MAAAMATVAAGGSVVFDFFCGLTLRVIYRLEVIHDRRGAEGEPKGTEVPFSLVTQSNDCIKTS